MICGICGERADLRYPNHPGYLQDQHFHIYACRHCGTSQSWPRVVDVAIYDLIYKRAADVPGYDRYLSYADAVATEPDALQYLAGKEDIYWAIREVLAARPTGRPGDLRVLEIGCGLGYLTHALRQARYQATGIDISEVAVSAATDRFGPHFSARRLEQLSETEKYDVVIATEVLEHVPDPEGFVRDALAVLAPGGQLVLTSPNRTSYAESAVWVTDNPPVHLWWFSERSVATIAARVGCSVEFTDFSAFNQARAGTEQAFLEGLPQRSVPFHEPIGIAHAAQASTAGANPPRDFVRTQLKAMGVLGAARNLRRLFHRLTKGTSTRRPCFCVVLARSGV
jgi:SAM-dependent methyltransferase